MKKRIILLFYFPIVPPLARVSACRAMRGSNASHNARVLYLLSVAAALEVWEFCIRLNLTKNFTRLRGNK